MTDAHAKRPDKGPFRAHQIRSGDPYELSNGHSYYCAPAGGDHASAAAAGARVLATDPAVESAGVEAGFSPTDDTLRAPDIAVGGVPDEPGWIRGAPPLAVEYASRGQDEQQLQTKIHELLGAGTQYVWVVRLIGPRRVEVYQPELPMRIVSAGEQLVAEGVLRNAVPIEALYDPQHANDVTLRNLLQQHGYDSVDEVRARGREEGREEGRLAGRKEGLVRGIEALCQALEIPLDEARRSALAAMDEEQLQRTLAQLGERRAWP